MSKEKLLSILDAATPQPLAIALRRASRAKPLPESVARFNARSTPLPDPGICFTLKVDRDTGRVCLFTAAGQEWFTNGAALFTALLRKTPQTKTETTEEFLARGGVIQQIAPGRALDGFRAESQKLHANKHSKER